MMKTVKINKNSLFYKLIRPESNNVCDLIIEIIWEIFFMIVVICAVLIVLTAIICAFMILGAFFTFYVTGLTEYNLFMSSVIGFMVLSFAFVMGMIPLNIMYFVYYAYCMISKLFIKEEIEDIGLITAVSESIKDKVCFKVHSEVSPILLGR